MIESEQQQAPNPNEKLVQVFGSEQESETMVVKGLLDSEGIANDVTSTEAQQDILPGVGGTIILVREEDAARALALIEEYRASGEDESEDADLSDDPRAAN
jgi:hypothetical protein